MNKYDFLSSTRFWAMIIASVAIYLKTKGIFGDAEMVLVATITSGFTIVRTIDRNTDAKVDAAIITAQGKDGLQ